MNKDNLTKFGGRHEQSLYRNDKTGVFSTCIKIKGVVTWHCLETDDHGEARVWRDLWKAQMRALKPSKNGGSKDITLEELAKKLIARAITHELKAIDDLESIVRVLLAQCPWPLGAKIRVNQITPRDIEIWIDGGTYIEGGVVHPGLRVTYARLPKKLGQKLAASTLNKYKRVIKDLFELAERLEIRIDDPTRRADIVKRNITPGDTERFTATIPEFLGVVRFTRGNLTNPSRLASANVIEYMGLFGVGPAEAAAATWGMIDFQVRLFFGRRIKTGRAQTVPLYEHAIPFINRLWDEATKENGGVPPSLDTKLFKVRNVYFSLRRACRELGFNYFSPIAIRRSFVEAMLRAGLNYVAVGKLEGHAPKDLGKLIKQRYGAGIISDALQRHIEELEAMKPELDVARDLYGVAAGQEIDPRALLAQANRPKPKVWTLSEVYARVDALLERINAGCRDRMKKAQKARRAGEVKMIQSELIDLNEEPARSEQELREQAELKHMNAMRAVKDGNRAKKLQELIDAGDLEHVLVMRRKLYNETATVMRVIKAYIAKAAFPGQVEEAKAQLEEATRQFNEARRAKHDADDAMARKKRQDKERREREKAQGDQAGAECA